MQNLAEFTIPKNKTNQVIYLLPSAKRNRERHQIDILAHREGGRNQILSFITKIKNVFSLSSPKYISIYILNVYILSIFILKVFQYL